MLCDFMVHDDDLIRAEGEHLYLNEAHPEAADILRDAGVSAERAKIPIITFWHRDNVLDEDEVEEAFRPAGNRLDAAASVFPRWYPTMESYLEQEIDFTKSSVLEEPTVLLVNFGAHWNIGQMGHSLTIDDCMLAYRRGVSSGMLDSVLFAHLSRKKIDIFERRVRHTPFPISLFWRTMAPGQIDCKATGSCECTRSYRFSG